MEMTEIAKHIIAKADKDWIRENITRETHDEIRAMIDQEKVTQVLTNAFKRFLINKSGDVIRVSLAPKRDKDRR